MNKNKSGLMRCKYLQKYIVLFFFCHVFDNKKSGSFTRAAFMIFTNN